MLRLNFISLLGITAAVLNVLLAVKIATQPSRDRIARNLLVAVLLCATALLVDHLYRYRVTRLYLVFPHFSGAMMMLMYCLGPALYAYVRRVTLAERPWGQRLWFLHWLLPLAVEIYLIPRYGRSAQEKFAALRSVQASNIRLALYVTNYLQILAYVALCAALVRRHRGSFAAGLCALARDGAERSAKFCWGLASVVVLGTVAVVTGSVHAHSLLLAVNASFGFLLAYASLGTGQALVTNAVATPEVTPNVGSEKYARSGLQSDTAQYYLNKLQTLMVREQCFLDESLSLARLAERLNLSAHHLSQLLNEQLQTTFYAYINEHRIEYAKQLLREHPDRAIVDIASAAGYDNKSTFYSAFKRQVGMTPAQYRNGSNATDPDAAKRPQ